jgi:hypothetical protein
MKKLIFSSYAFLGIFIISSLLTEALEINQEEIEGLRGQYTSTKNQIKK